MDSFSIQNFGCRVNQAESFAWAGEFQELGLRLEQDPKKSRLVIVNTCTLTGRADRDGRKFIRRIIRLNPQARLVVTGCLAERSPGEFNKIQGVWKVIPNSAKRSLPAQVLPDVTAVADGEMLPFRSRALLKVQDGCAMTCTFCIIPKVRGKSTSVPKEDVVGRARSLVSRGFREIVLTGIHLCSYGRDLRPKSSLLELLRETENVPGEFKIRLSSLDPRLLSRSLLDHMTSSKKVCSHFHLSLQHGSERMLKAMGRDSTISEYRTIMTLLRNKSPESAIGADIIVGFPEETDEDFRAMEDFLRESPLAYFHVFSYSPRPGTAAFGLNPVDEKTKKERGARLRKISKQKNAAFHKSFIGRILDGVVIRKNNKGVEILTSNYIDVCVSSCLAREGEAVKAMIVGATDGKTVGEVIE